MRFWDSSALVPLVLDEATSDVARSVLAQDRDVMTWWATATECMSAIARVERLGASPSTIQISIGRLNDLIDTWSEVEPNPRIRDTASRLLRAHELRAADALQLAAATAASEGTPFAMPFVTLDARLAVAADREGFPVVRFDVAQL